MDKPNTKELFEEYGGNAWGLARKRWGSSPWFSDDLEQEAYLALLEAAEAFDWDLATHPGQFGAYLERVVNREMHKFHASMSFATTGSSRSLLRHRFHDATGFDSEAMEYAAARDNGADEDDTFELLDAISSTLDDLTARQRRVIGLYYLDGILDDGKVADVLGVTRQSVQELRTRAEARIRELVNVHGD